MTNIAISVYSVLLWLRLQSMTKYLPDDIRYKFAGNVVI